MINLLPPDNYQAILYARRNTRLVRWIIACFAGLAIMSMVVMTGQLFINKSAHSYQQQADAAQEQLKVQQLDKTEARVKDISGSLKLVVDVLGREVLFSKLLQQIGSVMPPGSSLAGISIVKTQGGIDLNAVAKDYQTASQIQVNLADPNNKIFDKADIVNITCASNPSDPAYPCQITLRAAFASNNPFLFINTAGTKS
jgi:Tfp pilus assembly protein PilN